MELVSKTLLLVEDEAIIALTEKRWLINEGFRVIHVTSGEQAIKTVQTDSDKIDLILMDIDLGHGCMDGTQAAREILKTHDIPLLFLSSHTEKEIVDKTEQITSYGYVVKGSTDTVLLASIKMAFKLYKANQEIKAREESLKEREFWLNASQKVAKIGSYRADFQADIWSSSSVLSEIFGIDEQYTRSVAGWINLVHPEDREMMNDYLHKIFEEQIQFDKEYRILRPSDQRMFWVHGMGKLDFDEAGNPLTMIGTIQDITERKLMDEALRRSEENLSTTLHSIGDGVIATDSKGNIVRMNPAAERLCGWPLNEAEGKPLSEVFHIINSESRKEVENPVKRVLETGEIVGLANHTVLVARGGKEYQIADSAAPISNKTGEITGVVLVFSDVSEQYKIQAALKDSEEQLRMLVSKMEQGLALHEIILDDNGNPKDYRFLDANESFEKLTGLRRESIIGKTVLEVMPGTENYWIERYGQVALAGRPVHFEDYSQELGKYYSITAYSPRPLQFAVIISDITKRREEEKEIKLSEQRLNSLVNVLQFQCNSIQAYLDYALDESIKLTQSKIGYIYYYDEVKKEFTLNTWSKDVMKECRIRNQETKYKLEFTGIWGEAVRQGKPIIVNDFKMPNDLKKGYPDGHVQISKFMTIPIINDNKIAGVVGLANKESDYTQTDVLQLTFLMDAVWKVTEKKKAEMAFKESEEKYKMVFNASPDSFSISRMDGRYVDVNEGFLRLTGFTREEVIGASISEIQKLDIPGDRNDFNSSLQENGLVENLESAFRCKNGEVKTVLVSARIINIDNEPHILSITKDISYKKGIENDLKKAKELYLKIFDDFPALIWRAGTDKLCNYFNRTWLEFTGRTFEQENGNGWAEGVHPDDFSSCVDTYINAFDKREAFSMEYRLKNSSGEYRWLRDFGRPFFDLDNSFLGYIGSCYDITVNKQNEELIIESNAAKDRLLSIVAHDLRGPFTGFIGLSKALATQLDTLSKEEISEFGSAIYITAKKLNDLLNNLLEWSRLQSGKVYFEPTEFLLFREVENIRDLFSSAVSDKSINIINEVELNTAVYADKKMLSTVLGNLTSNAIKFTPSGGKITISAKAEDNFVRVSVSDTGIGMTEEKLAKAFKIDSVFTTKGTNGETGTGFGLLLCKEMVEKNGGNIFINSSLEKGSEFVFTIPAASGWISDN